MIAPGSRITLHFSLRLESGEAIEDTRTHDKPATFTLGDGNLLPGFERQLLGLKKGAKRSFVISAEDAFGLPDAKNIRQLDQSAFASLVEPADLKPGLVLGFPDAKGQEVPGVVKQVASDKVTVDFNHPLAGRDILFEVDILDVQAGGAGKAGVVVGRI